MGGALRVPGGHWYGTRRALVRGATLGEADVGGFTRTVFDGAGLPARERLAALREAFTASEHPMGITSSDADHFQATVRGVELAGVDALELKLSACEMYRSAQMVRQADPGLVCFAMVCSGTVTIGQGGREAVLEPRDLVVYDSSRPFHMRLAAGDPVSLVRVSIRRARLGLPADRISALTARSLTGRSGFGALLTQFLDGLFTTPEIYKPVDLPRMGVLAQDLLSAVAAHHADAGDAAADVSHQRALLLRIEAFVQQNLHVPELSPGTIARAHQISVGYLHRLFSVREQTIAAWIRRLRLERACRDLTDPMLRDVPLHRIAARSGFKEHSSFTRAFRSAYGVSPRDYRRHVLSVSA